MRYGLLGEHSRELLTYGGQILTHTNRAELEFLIRGARIIEVPPHIPDEHTMPISTHPAMAGVTFPLRRKDFR